MSLDTNSAQLNNLLAEINALPNSVETGATNLRKYIEEEIAVVSSNKFDKTNYTPNVKLNDTTGAVESNSSFCATHYIHWRKGQKMCLTRNGGESGSSIIRSIEFFDINKNRIAWKSSTGVSGNGFANAHTDGGRQDAWGTNDIDGSYYVKIYFPIANLNGYVIEVYNNTVNPSGANTERVPVLSYQSIEGISNQNYWYGKTIASDGDSITYGYGNAERSYVNYAAEMLGCSVNNTAIGGSTLAVKESDPTSRDPLIDRYTNMGSGDVCIINIGSNDWEYSWTPFGDMTSTTKYTFYGALKLLCEGLLQKYSGKPMVFCTPIKRVQGDGIAYDQQNNYGKTLKDYADAIKEVCEFYGIPVLDFYSECLINPKITGHNQAYFSSADGTHPNAVGHTILARRLKGYLEQLASYVRNLQQ